MGGRWAGDGREMGGLMGGWLRWMAGLGLGRPIDSVCWKLGALPIALLQVGRLVEYIGRVVYAGEDGSLRVIVKAHRLSLRTGKTDPTNQFHFIFRPSSK